MKRSSIDSRLRAPLIALFLLLALTSSGFAQDLEPASTKAEDEESEIDLFKLDQEARQIVTTITKLKQDVREAPSVVSVVTREDIRARGYQSLAEVLAATAGFRIVDNLISGEASIRGISGAARLLKVMIDGVPVDFRPTTDNPLGPELIPLQLVER